MLPRYPATIYIFKRQVFFANDNSEKLYHLLYIKNSVKMGL